MPQVGDDVFIAAGAKLIGDFKVGNNVFIGVNTLVTEDIPDNSKVTVEIPLTITTQASRQ
jgi:serine O-acetyltransferase